MSDGRANRMIGVFTADLDDAYQTAIWRGIESRAQDMNLGIICVVGSRLASPDGPANVFRKDSRLDDILTRHS